MDKILKSKNDNKLIANLIELIDKFSVVIYQTERNESAELLIEIIDKLDSIVGLKSNFILENNFKTYMKELTNILPVLLDAFENSDNVLMSDVLNYEIKPVLEKWSVKLS